MHEVHFFAFQHAIENTMGIGRVNELVHVQWNLSIYGYPWDHNEMS